MKKAITLFLLFLILSGLSMAQSKSYNIYDAYKGSKGFSTYFMTEEFLNSIDLSMGDDVSVKGEMTEIRMLFFNAKQSGLKGKSFRKLVLRYLPRPPYRNVAPSPAEKNDLEEMEFWVLGKREAIEECHIILEDSEFGILLSFYGKISEEGIVEKETLTFWQKLFKFKREKNEEGENL